MDNIIQHQFQISKQDRNKLKGHPSFVVWFTGLSGSGKSTVANALENILFEKGFHTYILDGDNIRKGLNADLSFSPKDRTENIRRIAEVANLMVDAGVIVLSAFVSPYRKDRNQVKETVGASNFVEVFVNTPLAICEKRDVKGLYSKARKGEIKDFTGINAPYEAPENPAIKIDTSKNSLEECVAFIFKAISNKLLLSHE